LDALLSRNFPHEKTMRRVVAVEAEPKVLGATPFALDETKPQARTI
jgi:hypothetical protein